MDDLKHLARTIYTILSDWDSREDLKFKPVSKPTDNRLNGTRADLERALDTANKILDGRKIHLETA